MRPLRTSNLFNSRSSSGDHMALPKRHAGEMDFRLLSDGSLEIDLGQCGDFALINNGVGGARCPDRSKVV